MNDKWVKRLLVALVLGAVVLAARYTLFRAGADYMVNSVNDAYAPLQQRAQRDAYVSRARAANRTPAAAERQLADNERCLGGSIVRVDDVDGVPTYTQMTANGRPLACPN